MSNPKVSAPFYYYMEKLLQDASEADTREDMNEKFVEMRNHLLGRFGRPWHENDSPEQKSQYLKDVGIHPSTKEQS